MWICVQTVSAVRLHACLNLCAHVRVVAVIKMYVLLRDVRLVVVLVRCWAITGTLDPVRNLTGLTVLYLFQNSIGGMFVRTADGTLGLVVVSAC